MTGWAEHAAVLALAFGLSPAMALAVSRQARSARVFYLNWACNDAAGMIVALAVRHWTDAGAFAAAGVLALLLDWWRRNRDRVKRELGAKARAVLARMGERLADRVLGREGVPA